MMLALGRKRVPFEMVDGVPTFDLACNEMTEDWFKAARLKELADADDKETLTILYYLRYGNEILI